MKNMIGEAVFVLGLNVRNNGRKCEKTLLHAVKKELLLLHIWHCMVLIGAELDFWKGVYERCSYI